MRISNDKHIVEIREWINLKSNEEVDLLYDPHKHISSEFSKAWKISVSDSNKQHSIVLVDHMVASCSCILQKEELIILLSGYIAILNLNTYELTTIDNLENHGCFYAIYEYDDGYIIHGELEIIKLSSSFVIEWTFSGSDIFARADGTDCFEIVDDRVLVRCWDGLEVLLNSTGSIISETYNK